ncbi:hypothetical protein CJ194_00060 [Priestia megaterium]|nr:hypothetical protein COI96_27255 [Priestia megaterium]PMD09911.1 hypothetical protein CJ194_00060 [Priestia megaterium]
MKSYEGVLSGSSFLFITSWLIRTISVYLFVIVLMAPSYAFIPFCKVIGAGLVCFYLSKKLNKKTKTN